jgi:integrase
MPGPTKLTETFISRLPYEGKTYAVRDAHTTGLMVAVNKTSKSYKVQRDLWRGQRGRRRLVKTVRHTLGTTDELTLDEARTRAQEVIAQIKRGTDPNAPGAGPGAEIWTVGGLWDEYEADMIHRGLADRTIAGFRYHLDKYLADWRAVPLTELRRSMCRDRHRKITERHGPYPANQVMRSLRVAWNFALRVVDDPDALPGNPVAAITFHRERRREAVIMPEDLPVWWVRVQGLGNPLRREMHALGILSGLRPGTLVSLERSWIDLEAKAIKIPRMKSGREFHLPLSDFMVEHVRRALELGDVLFPRAPWLFPTRSNDGRRVIATQVWREKTLPSETGHILRHTYRTLAHAAGITETDGRLLLDQKVPGISGVYIQERALFTHLRDQQQHMSHYVMGLCAPASQET